MEYNSLSLIPPLLAIILAIVSKDVVLSLFTGLFAGHFIINDFNLGNAFVSLFDAIVGLFSEGWITKTLLFALLVGSIIRLIVDSGGVAGFVDYLTQKKNLIQSKRGALMLAYVIGLLIFIESSITSLVAGTVARPLTDRFGASRQKLAYVCDSTSAPVSSLLAFNGWGALLIVLITEQVESSVITGHPTSLFIHSIPFNFYAIIALLIVFFVILTDWNIGPMHSYERIAKEKLTVFPQKNDTDNTSSSIIENKDISSFWNMLLPLLVLVATIPVALYLSGNGDMLQGSGSTSVFYAVICSLLFTFAYYMMTKAMTKKAFYSSFYQGMGDMIPIVLILILALAIGKITNQLGTGQYLASITESFLTPAFIPAVTFSLAAIIAFSTGTSWGTFSIMMPIAIGLGATSPDANIPLIIGAVVSGGIFGDHASPISDTTIISSLAAKCDHIEHVTTQLPYALLGAGFSIALFIIFGFI